MSWIVTMSGREVDLINPDPKTIWIMDLIYAISQLNRFTGHTKEPYTVLQHSLQCQRYAEDKEWSKEAQLACLCHDLHEGIIGDISTPMKRAVPEIAAVEKRVEAAVHKSLGLTEIMQKHESQVKQADLAMLLLERKLLLPPVTRLWEVDAMGLDAPMMFAKLAGDPIRNFVNTYFTLCI
jgi:uncharacterized protein